MDSANECEDTGSYKFSVEVSQSADWPDACQIKIDPPQLNGELADKSGSWDSSAVMEMSSLPRMDQESDQA